MLGLCKLLISILPTMLTVCQKQWGASNGAGQVDIIGPQIKLPLRSTRRKLVSYKSAGNFPTKCFLGTNLNTTVFILNMCRKFSYKMQENFLHTSVKCCTSAGKFPAHTVKLWIFLSRAGNMIPALQPPNTGALSLRLSFISFGTCSMQENLLLWQWLLRYYQPS